MTNFFVLFALFTVGSATDVVDCSNGGNFNQPCVKNDLLGKCHASNGSCETDMTGCTGKEKYDPCGAGDAVGLCEDAGANKKCLYTAQCDDPGAYCNNDTQIGICSAARKCNTIKPCFNKDTSDTCGPAATGKCKTAGGICALEEKSITVRYSVEVPTADRLEYYDKLGAAPYTDANLACHPKDDVTMNVSLGSLGPPTGSGTCKESHFAGAAPCKLTCKDPNVEKTSHTRKCDIDGVWTGVKGVCAQQCSNLTASVSGFSYDGTSKVATFASAHDATPAQGTYTCHDTFRDGKACKLSCATGYRVKTATNYGCQTAGTWSGTVAGVCEASSNVFASATFVLQTGELLEDVVQEQDKAFNKRFVDSVSTLLGAEVLPENVNIVNIMAKSGRRLNESSVHVDYTLRVPKGDPEGATELVKIDGTQSPKYGAHSPEVGGVFRGIR